MRSVALAPVFALAALGPAGFGLAACGGVDDTPSSGTCGGAIGPLPIDLALDPEPSEFHRSTELLLGEDGLVTLVYGESAIVVTARWEDMPMAADVGAHPIPTAGLEGDGVVQSWVTEIDGVPVGAGLAAATLTLDESGRTRLVGDFALRFDDGSELVCDLHLRRAYELE